jgi:hypothetical protein
MTLFTLIIFAGQGAGAMCFSYIDATLGWRWCFWINLISELGQTYSARLTRTIVNGTCLAGIYFLLAETRGSAILEARAIRLTKETGRPHLANTSLVQTLPFWTKLRRSVTRPVIFLFTEPTVALMALWTGCLWGEASCAFGWQRVAKRASGLPLLLFNRHHLPQHLWIFDDSHRLCLRNSHHRRLSWWSFRQVDRPLLPSRRTQGAQRTSSTRSAPVLDLPGRHPRARILVHVRVDSPAEHPLDGVHRGACALQPGHLPDLQCRLQLHW